VYKPDITQVPFEGFWCIVINHVVSFGCLPGQSGQRHEFDVGLGYESIKCLINGLFILSPPHEV
jgi:hypothetical protein